MNAIAMFPRHKCGLFLHHNEHRDYYQSLPDWLEDRRCENDDWAAPGQKELALATDECWHLQWYPDTPVGFFDLYAADLDVLLEAAMDIQQRSDADRDVLIRGRAA